MSSGSDRSRERTLRVWHTMVVFALMVVCAHGAIAPPDSLTKRQKQTINSLAESKLKEYIDLLNGIAFLSSNDEDAMAADEYIGNAVKGDERTFSSADATVESNIDPELRTDAMSRNRKAEEYLNDFKLQFKRDDDQAVLYTLLMRAEPQVIGGRVSTRLLYEVRFNGHNEMRPGASYKAHHRVAELIAEEKGAGSWRVTIATDAFRDSTRVFTQFSVDRDLAALKQGTIQETPELVALRAAEEAEKRAVAEEAAKKKKAYEDAIAAGKEAVAAGDFDLAISMYSEARRHDPFAIDPLVLTRKAEQARKIKQQRDEKDFEEYMTKGRTLRGMNDYARALEAYQRAATIFPGDARCKPMIDSLDAMIKQKADRERFLDAKDYTASLGEAQRLLKLPGMLDDPDIKVLQAKSYRGLGKQQDALRVLEEVLKRHPNHGDALRTRAYIYRNGTKEERTKAAPSYMVLMNRDKWDMSSYHGYAELLCFEQNNCREAMKILQDALTREPGNMETLYLLARVNSVDGFKEYPTALRYLDGALERDSSCGKCWLERGIALLHADSVKAAEIAIARAKSVGLPQLYADRADTMAARNYREARRLVEMQGRENADRIFERASILDPEQPGYRYEKAENLHIMKKYADAIKDLDIHIEHTPAPYKALLLRASCKVYTGDYPGARKDAEEILINQVESYLAPAHLVAGQAAYFMNEIGTAESHFKETLRLTKKKDAKANYFMTLISIKSDRKDEARSYAEKTVDLEPLEQENYMNLGRALQINGDVNGSVSAFKEALRLGADRGDVEKEIGKSYYKGGKYKDAIEHFNAHKLLKDDKEVPVMAADCYFELEQFTESVRELNELMARHEEVEYDIEFESRLAYLYVIVGEINTAKGYLDKAMGLDKENTLRNAQMQVADVAYKWKNNDKVNAVVELKDLVQRNVFNEKRLKELPVLKDIVSDRLWKAK